MKERPKNYYGYAYNLPKDDDRLKEFKLQRNERGFDDTETWSLYSSIAYYTLPRLKRFRESGWGIPCGITKEEWAEILDKMILGFELVVKDDESILTKEENGQMD